ncbi:MAG: amino acid--[acyl-carrier-protein] ligase, partial [Ilumatobacteraceae bacterium]
MTPEDLVEAHIQMRDRLVAAGLLIPAGAPGLYGRNSVFERVVDAVDQAVLRAGSKDGAVVLEFPPLIPKTTFDQVGYLRNFPNLVGPLFTFDGGDREHAQLLARLEGEEPYDDLLAQSEVAFTPACCYPVYPTLSGELPSDGTIIELKSYCFRREPSPDPMRMQAFRQREHVRVGTPDQVLDWRETWLERAPQLFDAVGLPVRQDLANDPFFGRAGRLMAMSQREQELKIEFLVPIFGDDHATACSSVNYHQDHFGRLFGISGGGSPAHSSCIGFGLERWAVALFA